MLIATAFFAWFSFLLSWVGIAVFIVYVIIISSLFEDDWWLRGAFFLLLPIIFAIGLGAMEIPNWKQAILWVVGYLGIGIVWSFPRFALLVNDIKKAAKGIINDERNWHHLTDGDKWMRLTQLNNNRYFADFLNSNAILEKRNITPDISSKKAKARIFSWILYWPFSFLNYVYTRLLKDLVDFMVERLKGVYNIIAKAIMKDLTV